MRQWASVLCERKDLEKAKTAIDQSYQLLRSCQEIIEDNCNEALLKEYNEASENVYGLWAKMRQKIVEVDRMSWDTW